MNTDWVLVIALMRLIEEKRITADAAIEVLKSGKSMQEFTSFLEEQAKLAKPKKQPPIGVSGMAVKNIFENNDFTIRNGNIYQNHPVFDAPVPMEDIQEDIIQAPVRRDGFRYEYEMRGPDEPVRLPQLYVHPEMAERARRMMNMQQREMDALRGVYNGPQYNPPLDPPAPPVRAPIDPLNGQVNAEVQQRALRFADALPPAVRGNGHRIRQ